MSRAEIQDLLASLRWREDMIVTNDFGVRVWLKICFLKGERVGITDCCEADDPCDVHAAMTHSTPPRTQ